MKTIYYLIFIILTIYLILVIKYQFRINDELTIQQVNNPNYLQVENIIKERSPSIITGWLEQISDLKDWNFQYFKNKIPDYEVTLKQNIIEQEKTKIITFSLDKYINFLELNKNSNNLYLSEDLDFLSVNKLDKPIHDFFNKYFQSFGYIKTTAFWLGNNYTRTGLHYDKDNINLLCQVHGKKKVILFSPSQTSNLYPNDKYDHCAVLSKINFWNPDLKMYPKFNDAKYIEIILSEGQILIIPPYWWHAVENIGDNIAFSYRVESIGSIISKIPDLFKNILHKCGLYKNNNCVCCSEDISKYA